MLMLCTCGNIPTSFKNGVLVIWKNGAMQLADMYKCKCGNSVFVGFGEHIAYKVKDETQWTRFYQETSEYIES